MASSTSSVPWELRSVHHLGLTVSDLERSILFYRDLLGLPLLRRRPHVDSEYVALQTGYPGVILSVASFQLPGPSAPTLELVQYLTQGGPHADAATNRPGACHLCLAVNDLRACYADLQAKGVRFHSEPVTITAGPNTGGVVVYFHDPDGYTLELFQAP